MSTDAERQTAPATEPVAFYTETGELISYGTDVTHDIASSDFYRHAPQ